MDVPVVRAAVTVQIEHAAGARGRRPELDLAALDGEHRRLLCRHQVVALMRAAGARLTEVVDVRRVAGDREDQRRHDALRPCSSSSPGGGEAERKKKEKNPSGGCGAEAHVGPGSRSKAHTLQPFATAAHLLCRNLL